MIIHGDWTDAIVCEAILGKLWRHLKGELASGVPTPRGLAKALKIGRG